ncbi:MAG: glycine cleavage system aminomethyltransferase GcvT [Clostridia bacterium]|nr:glycine cleavage system aminomethyltransferase GcvT [Clostridia bacterium]
MIKKTPLYEKHLALNGKIVEFAGWYLPVQYEMGIIAEHHHVRNKVGLFDVSHMGELYIYGEKATENLQKLVTNRVETMAIGQCRYTLMLYKDGGIVDDLLIYRLEESKYLLVVNASNCEKDYNWIVENLADGAKCENISASVAQIAMQGPLSDKVLAKICDMEQIPQKNYHFTKRVSVAGIECLVSTTGYTGERGYELYTANENAIDLYDKLIQAGEEFDIKPIGLGARDTLRFESSMPLYGHELSAETKGNEVGLDFAIKHTLGYIGEEYILGQPEYQRVGMKVLSKGIVREHCEIYDEQGNLVGKTTSGGFCPTKNGAYAMARIKVESAKNTLFYIDVRGRKLQAKIIEMPFYKRVNA